jgi:NADH-quinone oxidoreductase subunit C
MSAALTELQSKLSSQFADHITASSLALGELSISVKGEAWLSIAASLRDQFQFETLIDLCGVDYSTYGDGAYQGLRFAAVVHLLSLTNNQRLRVKVFAADDSFPILPSVVDVWPVVNWFERECFDLFGVMFEGHPDLRRLLTDYGFVGHPFRKDFPTTGYVEMRYDEASKRVIYQPVTIETREITPRVIREETYAS